jgi:hypothetical protein
MGYGAAYGGIMVGVGAYYNDSDEDEFCSTLDSESEASDWGDDSEELEQPSAVSRDLSVVLTLPLDVIYEVCNS